MMPSTRTLALLFTLSLTGCAATHSGGSQSVAPAKTVEITYRWDGEAWASDYRTVYSYGREGGEPTIVTNQSWTDGAWADVSKEEWALDAEGRQLRGTTYQWGHGGWSEDGRMAFFYDANGDKAAARRGSIGENGAVTNADSLASTFVSGLETERRFFRWSEGEWTEGLRQTSAYDAAGRETVRLHLAPGAGEWEEQRRWTFTYDETGRLTNSVVEQVEDGSWTPWLNQAYTYDADGNQTEIVHEEWTGSEWRNMMRNETRYALTR